MPTVHWTNTQAAVLLQRRGKGEVREAVRQSFKYSSMLYTIIKKTIYMILSIYKQVHLDNVSNVSFKH